ncbi:unnamed protein product, partial [Medioppia subpectinata]
MSDRLVSAKTSATVTARDDSQALTYESILESFVDQNSFKCHYDGCDKSLPTQRRLDLHISRRHAVQHVQPIGNSCDSRQTAPDDSLQRWPIAATSPPLSTASRSDDMIVNTSIRDPRLRNRSTNDMIATICENMLQKPYVFPVVANDIQTTITSTISGTPSGQSSAVTKPVAKVVAGSHLAANTCHTNTTQTNTHKRRRRRRTRREDLKVRSKHRKQDTNDHHVLHTLSSDEDTNSDTEVEIIPDDSSCFTSTVPPPLTTADNPYVILEPVLLSHKCFERQICFYTTNRESDSDIEIVAIVDAPIVLTTGGAEHLGPSSTSQTVPNEERRLSIASDTTLHYSSPTRTPVPSDMELDTDVEDSPTITPVPSDTEMDDDIEVVDDDLLYPTADEDLPNDEPIDPLLPDEDYYHRFDSLVERVAGLLGADTTAAADVKPVIGAEDHTSSTHLNSDITCDIKLDINANADNSAPDVTTDTVHTVSLVSGDCVPQTDQTLELYVKPIITDPGLQTVSDKSLAATSSAQTEGTASVEPVMADIPSLTENETNNTANACITPTGAVIANIDCQTIAATNHKNSDTNTAKEMAVNEETVVVNSGQKSGGQSTATTDKEIQKEGADKMDQSVSDISSTEINFTAIADHNKSGEEVAKESVPASVRPKRGPRLPQSHYRSRNTTLREALGLSRGDEHYMSDINSDSDADSDQSMTPFDGLLLDVSQRMASKVTSPSKTGHRSSPHPSVTRSRSLTPRDGAVSGGYCPETLPMAKQYICRGHGKTFANRYEFNEHQYIVHGLTHPYRCEYDDGRETERRCRRRYDRAFDYVRHQRHHHSLRVPYECEYSGCDQYFDHRSAIKEHIRKAHGKQRPFVCDRADCGQSFGRETQLYAHKRDDHTNHFRSGDRPLASLKVTVSLAFWCDYERCGQRFASQSALDGHNVDKHSGDYHKRDAKDCGQSFFAKSPAVSVNCPDNRPALDSNLPLGDQSVPKLISTICQYQCDYNECFGMFATEEILQKHKKAVHQKHDQLLTSAQELSPLSVDSTTSQTLPALSIGRAVSEALPGISSDISVPNPMANTSNNDTITGGVRLSDIPVPTPANAETNSRLWDTLLGVVTQPPAMTVTLTDTDISDVISETTPALDTIASSASVKLPTGRLIPPPLPPSSLLSIGLSVPVVQPMSVLSDLSLFSKADSH